jgi:penicillin-binding protein 1A
MAIAKSKNLVLVRVLQAIGPQYAQDYITRFGFDPKQHPPYLTMGSAPGLDDAAADGRRILGVRQRRLPRLPVSHRAGHRLQGQRAAQRPGPWSPANRRSARSTRATLRDDRRCCATWSTSAPATKALSLGRKDLAGKTGHDQRERRCVVLRIQRVDRRRVVDRLRPAAHARQQRNRRIAALPIWVSFMQKALKGRSGRSRFNSPEGVISVRVNPDTGCATTEAA